MMRLPHAPTSWLLAWGLASGWLVACSGTHEPSKELTAKSQQAIAPAAMEYDVPGLVGLSIAELATRLGPAQPVPADFRDPVSLPLEQRGLLGDSAVLFRAAKLPVIVTFDVKTQKVSDLIVLGQDEERLMQRANLQVNASNYIVLSVFQARHSDRLLGIRVVAK